MPTMGNRAAARPDGVTRWTLVSAAVGPPGGSGSRCLCVRPAEAERAPPNVGPGVANRIRVRVFGRVPDDGFSALDRALLRLPLAPRPEDGFMRISAF